MSDWNTILVTTSFISFFFAVLIYRNKNNLFSFFTVYTIFYWIIMYSGVYIYYAMYLNFDFAVLNNEYIFLSVIYSTVAYIVFLISYKLFTHKFNIKIFPKVSYIELRMLGYFLLLINLTAILIYIAINGLVIFKSDSYSSRFEAAMGLGGLNVMFPLFLLSFTILFLTKPTERNWRFNFILGIVVAILIFLSTGGGRLMIALHTLMFLVIGYHYKYVKFKSIVLVVALLIPVASLMAFVRAKMDFDSELFQSLIFTMNTFSPFDSFVRIIEYYDNSNNTFEGLNVVYAQISSFIPRAIWPEKPIMVLNTGNFYTIEILNSKTLATISPTLNGSFYIIYGLPALIIGSILVGVLIKTFDNSFYRNPFLFSYYRKNQYTMDNRHNTIAQKKVNASLLHLVFYYYVFLNMFVLVREALDVFLISRVFIPLLLIILSLLAVKIILRR